MGAKGLKLNYSRISKEMGEKAKSARIRHYIFAKERGPRLYMSVPSWLSRHTLMFGSVVGGVRTPVATKISAKNDPTGSVPDLRTRCKSDSGGLQPLEKLPSTEGRWEGNTLPRPACGSFLIKAPPYCGKNRRRLKDSL